MTEKIAEQKEPSSKNVLRKPLLPSLLGLQHCSREAHGVYCLYLSTLLQDCNLGLGETFSKDRLGETLFDSIHHFIERGRRSVKQKQ